ncbi:hypothetical protein [Bifidobacterium myosotis]|uniref:Uncharacterized protein n=1 Tax=Bifidobacterium myosotis TaxID=1630166 RepID=A0A5M9ZKR7_9BIFI|nr:hypothetical protein [Bifidobacterium myosotis]KAA8828105.1 hypothetical protein EMO91_06605 [Bifidobacterium myosotis]
MPFKGNGTATDLATPSGSYGNYAAAKINSKWVGVNTSTCTAFDFPIGTVDYSRTNVDSGIYGGIGGTEGISPQILVDNDGRLWFQNSQKTVATANTYRFSRITYGTGLSGYDGTLLLGHRVADETQTAGTVINQSPTAGAPVSDLTIPALAVGGGLAALGFGLSRRRRA